MLSTAAKPVAEAIVATILFTFVIRTRKQVLLLLTACVSHILLSILFNYINKFEYKREISQELFIETQ
jgi:hypothetical protein